MISLNTRILIVDTKATIRKLLMKSLKEIGFKDFTEADGGRQALKELNKAHPSIGLIISEWDMPDSSGLDLLKFVRGSEKFKNITFIFMTIEGEGGHVAEAAFEGASGFLIKPVSTKILREKLEEVHQKMLKS